MKKILYDKSFWSFNATLARTIIYTIGHIAIAVTCNYLITGAAIELAAIDAIVEPIINAFWYFALDRIWSKYMIKENKNEIFNDS